MASLRTKMPPIASAQWILNERHQANQFVEQEVEEFGYSVRNEMEWLNEHMADIFSKDHLTVTDIFKTPGKLRGKTPRTARKRNPLETRLPLTDVFAPNLQAAPSPSQKTEFYKNVARFQVAEDQENSAPSPASQPQFSTALGKENTDSGYHGLSGDEIVVDHAPLTAKSSAWSHQPAPSTQDTIPDTQEYTQVFTQESTQATQPTQQFTQEPVTDERRTTEESFVSAKEVLGSKHPSKEHLHDDNNATIPDDETDVLPHQPNAPVNHALNDTKVISMQNSISAETASAFDSSIQQHEDLQDPMDVDDVRSPSDKSSPVKPLVRKSSLTFASLPAREPLTTKKSMGNRVSRTSHVDQAKARSSQFGRFTGGKSLGGSQYAQTLDNQDEDRMDLDDEDDDFNRPGLTRGESETTKLHNKTSTQRLHERINMLGQSKERDSSKSASQNNTSAQPTYPQLPSVEHDKSKVAPAPSLRSQKEGHNFQSGNDVEEEDDDWIAPIKSTVGAMDPPRPPILKNYSADVVEQIHNKTNAALESGTYPVDQKSPSRGASPLRALGKFGHSKSASASAITSPTKIIMPHDLSHLKGISVSNPDLSTVTESTTPIGSPTGKKYADGPLSASKAKLYSALRAAKEKFIGSSAASAQVKLDALSPGPTRQRLLHQGPSLDELFSPKRTAQTVPVPYPDIQTNIKEMVPVSAISGSPSKETEGRRTRSSSEREERRKEREAMEKNRVETGLEKLREKERQKAATQFQKAKAATREPVLVLQDPQPRAGAASRADTITSQEERSNSADEMPPPKSLLPTGHGQKLREPRRLMKAPSKDALPKTKPPVIRVNLTGNRFGQPSAPVATPQPPKQQEVLAKSSNDTLKSSTSSQPPAPRMNRALAAAASKKKEEERKAAEKEQKRRELEQKRANKLEEERLERERKAAEQREQEVKRVKPAQKQVAEAKQRQQVTRPGSRQGNNNLANALQQEKSNAQAHPRADLGAARPISRMHTVQDATRPIVPQINPVKPPKRVFQPEEDELVQRPAIQRVGPPYQQLDAKRRRTIDEEEDHENNSRPSVKAPPIRHSNMRKDAASKFPTGYMQAPPQSTSTMLKAATTHAHLQHTKSGHANEMAKFANGKIPFADAPNPPAALSSYHPQTYKTPARGGPGTAPTTAAKSSPHCPNGENIALPEIATDSEDEDSDTEFQAPSWVNSPALRELLTQQQLVDPEQIFGPIAPLQMEEVFKNKDRFKKFRERTSSAHWSQDMLTEEERRRDREGRERMMKDGGWQFHQGA